jgi:hypothetical protein
MVSFSIHFPIKRHCEFAKCRQFKRFQIFVPSFVAVLKGLLELELPKAVANIFTEGL